MWNYTCRNVGVIGGEKRAAIYGSPTKIISQMLPSLHWRWGGQRSIFTTHFSQKSIINRIRLDDEMGKKNGIKLEKSSKINGAGLVKEVKIWGKNR